MEKKIGMHIWVSGLVQGVFYRRFVQQEALRLTITGWVCNLGDGRVEAMLYGDQLHIEQLISLLWTGPPGASVEKLESQEVPWQNIKNFEIRR